MRDEKENEAIPGRAKRRGRPRRWADDTAKHRQHRALRRERAVLIEQALHAVRNAHWDDEHLEGVINRGEEDEAVLRALIAYCQARHWQQWEAMAREGSRREK